MMHSQPKIWPLAFFFLLFIFTGGKAQDISFTASAKTVVSEGEQFRLTYTLNSQGSGFNGPDLSAFRVLSGPNQSTNQSYQVINGKVAQSYSLTFTYYLQALKEGEYNIPPANVTAGGKTVESNSLQITVRKASNAGQTPGGASTVTDPTSGISKDDVFIKATIDKKNPYQGEQAIITYKIYTTLPISQININKLSSFPGFWYKDLLENNDRLQQYNETINGKQYVVADLRKIALFPQRSGELTIEPMELECTAQVRLQGRSGSRDPLESFFDDPFFSRNIREVPLILTSNEIDMNVKTLPAEGKPVSFRGSVGNFSINATLDQHNVKTNEAINLKVTISGKGNIELVDQPAFRFPPDFEVYDPKESTKVSRNTSGISGTRTFEYLIIPRTAGDFTIDPVKFSFFDPRQRKYTTLETPRFDITVEKGDEESASVSYSGVSQQDVQYIGRDVRHIKSYPFQLHTSNNFFFLSVKYYLFFGVPLVIFVLLIILWKQQEKRSGNIARIKNVKANKIARRNLRKADQYLKAGDTEAFFEEVSRALWGYLGNKFNLAPGDLSRDTVKEQMARHMVSEEHTLRFLEVLDQCEFARFSPGDASERMNELYNDALEIISTIEKELR